MIKSVRFLRNWKAYRKGEVIKNTGGVCRTFVEMGVAEYVVEPVKKKKATKKKKVTDVPDRCD